MIGSLVSLIGFFYAFFGKIFGRGIVPGWASTLMVISLLFFLLFVYLGVLENTSAASSSRCGTARASSSAKPRASASAATYPMTRSGANPAGSMAGAGQRLPSG